MINTQNIAKTWWIYESCVSFQASNTHGSAIFRQSPEGFSGSIRQVQDGLPSRSPFVFFEGADTVRLWYLEYVVLVHRCASSCESHPWRAAWVSNILSEPLEVSPVSQGKAAMDWQLITTPEDSRLVNSDFGYQGLVSEVKPLGQFRPSRLKENTTESRRNFKLLENGWNNSRWESSPFEFFQCNKTCKNTANPIIRWWLGHSVFFLWLLVSWPVCSQIDANVSQTSYLHYLASSVSRNIEHLAAGPHWGMATSGELRVGVFNEKDCIVKDVLHSDISLPNCYTSCASSNELL